MSVLPNLRNTATGQSFPYIDTPDFSYDQWLLNLQSENLSPIGTVSNAPTVAVIGGGVSGLCAAYELMRAGCSVAVFEQAAEVGGRCASDTFGSDLSDIAEMGSMRFPPSEFILNYYLTKFGLIPSDISGLPDFPDPGVVPTYICYGGQAPQIWTKANSSAPAGFATVYNGWIALVSQGLTTTGNLPTLLSATQITALLQQNNIAAATVAWQNYLNVFGQQTFYSALQSIFTGTSGYAIPGGTAWSFADFDKFGALGIGSGGFGPLYPISFTEILRIVVDGLENTQKFLQPNSFLKNGIRSLPLTFAQALGSAVATSSPISAISGNVASGFYLITPTGGNYGPFVRVIVATTTRSMELTLSLTNYTQGLVSPQVAQAIMRTHVVSSNKVAALIPNFWSGNPGAVRALQTDNIAHQVYTLDYTAYGSGTPDPNGVCFISYVWDDDAVKQQSITDGAPTGSAENQTLYSYLFNAIQNIGDPVKTWANSNLQPLNGDYTDNVIFEEWQSSPYFGGAFKLSQPGQDQYTQMMFFDYQKAGSTGDTGVYIAGDCLSWTSGWVEGGLTTGLNAAAGVIASLGGTLNTDANGRTPMNINANRYTYWG